MLRDIPRVYGMLLLFIGLLVGLVTWYTSSFDRDTTMLGLNEVILSSAVNQVDQSSRLHEGALLLAPDFEKDAWKRLSSMYKDGTVVQFDYKFDQTDTRFSGTPASSESPTYTVGGTAPTAATHYANHPIEAVRVKVKQEDDNVTDWTFVSTVTVDALSR